MSLVPICLKTPTPRGKRTFLIFGVSHAARSRFRARWYACDSAFFLVNVVVCSSCPIVSAHSQRPRVARGKEEVPRFFSPCRTRTGRETSLCVSLVEESGSSAASCSPPCSELFRSFDQSLRLIANSHPMLYPTRGFGAWS